MDNNHTQVSIFEQILLALAVVGILFFGLTCAGYAFGRSTPNGSMAIAASISFSSIFIGSILLIKR